MVLNVLCLSYHSKTPCTRIRGGKRAHTHSHDCTDIPTLTRIRRQRRRRKKYFCCYYNNVRANRANTIQHTDETFVTTWKRTGRMASGKKIMWDTLNTTLVNVFYIFFLLGMGGLGESSKRKGKIIFPRTRLNVT